MKLVRRLADKFVRARPRIILGACVLALFGLGLMAWSILDPRPVPVIVAMSVGQGAGTLSFLAFLAVAAVDVRWALARRGNSQAPPADGAAE